MPRVTPISTRDSGRHGASLPPRTGGGSGGGDEGRGRDRGDSLPDSLPNYGERLRRARVGLAVAMTPILMLFVSLSAVYLLRRRLPTLGVCPTAYLRNRVPVR